MILGQNHEVRSAKTIESIRLIEEVGLIDRLAHDMDVDDDDVPVRMENSFHLPSGEESRRHNPSPLPPAPDVTKPVDSSDNLASRRRRKINPDIDKTKREGKSFIQESIPVVSIGCLNGNAISNEMIEFDKPICR